MSATQEITAIAEPTITLVSGDLADECYVTPVQFAATPTPGAWTAPANSSGIVDRSCAVRPLNGYASYAFLAVNGGNCSAEGTEFNLPGCLLLDLGPDQLLCDNADTLVIGVQGPALGYSGVGGAFDTTTFVLPNSSYGYFYPGHAPGPTPLMR
ncbi:MAG: hypothetical protein IPL77_12365 [Flavobacteriales bacterium]|nr:hypothetical protein [Flavobacteriales bacterium]